MYLRNFEFLLLKKALLDVKGGVAEENPLLEKIFHILELALV